MKNDPRREPPAEEEQIDLQGRTGDVDDESVVYNSTATPREQQEQEQEQETTPVMEGLDARPPALAAVPISVQDWMRSALNVPPTRGSYVESAVNLALVLATYLQQTVAASAATLGDQVTINNLVILVRPPTLAEIATRHIPSIIDVKFRVPLPSAATRTGSAPPTCSRAACVALGKILLEIFSVGRSRPSEQGTDHDGNAASALNNHTRNRQPAAPVSGSGLGSDAARQLLLSLGMPLSVCRLVCDLLDAGNATGSNSALTSLGEAIWDLTQMKYSPQTHLFDCATLQKALVDTCLFGKIEGHFFGRDRVISALIDMKNSILAVHTGRNSDHRLLACKAAFLSGYAGSGKSSLLHTVIQACNYEQWFVLSCKFEQQSTPTTIWFSAAFDDFFGQWHSHLNPEMVQKIRQHIVSKLDNEGLHRLCEIVPNLAPSVFPPLNLRTSRATHQDQNGINSMDKIGSAKKRLQKLFHVLFKAICSVGRPVLFTLDDLQWSPPSAIGDITNYFTYEAAAVCRDDRQCSRSSSIDDLTDYCARDTSVCKQGIFVVGTFRSNEVDKDGDLMNQIDTMNESGRVDLTILTIDPITKNDVTNIVSSKLCLPKRYTTELAELVFSKTRGNPYFTIQFLRTIIRNNMLSFSIGSRRWTWDCDVIEMQMMSDGVAQLLASTFCQLSPTLMETVKIISCLGYQVEESTVDALDSRHTLLPFNMRDELPLAVGEGIFDKAGPMYMFTHDILQQTIYELIPTQIRRSLHKKIGESLLQSAVINRATNHLLAVDQINIFCKNGSLTPDECSRFANCNAVAAKHAIGISNFEQARSYIDTGIQLLETHKWETQYYLCLDLFEMSASVSCMHGDVTKMSASLDEILSHVRVFDDSVKALSLLVKLFAFSSKYDDARNKCLMVLSALGEEFPSSVEPPLVQNELLLMQNSLKYITADQFKSLQPMRDKNKLNAMKFMNMLCHYSNISKPMLLPLISLRMLRLTQKFGFCEDSIVGLATAGHTLFMFAEDIELARLIGKVSDLLIDESPKRNMLRSRLCRELLCSVRIYTEPHSFVLPQLSELYNSAMLVGDIENACLCRHCSCHVEFWTAASDLLSVSNHIVSFIKEAKRYQQHNELYGIISLLNLCSYLLDRNNIEVDVKSFDELDSIAEHTNSAHLLFHNFLSRLAVHFWMRDYKQVADLSSTFSESHPSSQQSRTLNVFRIFYEGIAHLNLARDTKQTKWKILGERAVTWMSNLASVSKWNFEHKSILLKAELHYLKGELWSAEVAYKASINSAREHEYSSEESLAHELYGFFCVENHMTDKGLEQLHIALGMYKQWGARKKVAQLQLFIDMANMCCLSKQALRRSLIFEMDGEMIITSTMATTS